MRRLCVLSVLTLAGCGVISAPAPPAAPVREEHDCGPLRSTLTRTTGSATVELRGGPVHHRSGQARWVVVRSDRSGLHFAPLARATNQFVWKREAEDQWTASLTSPGRPPVVYRMRRVPD